MTLEYLNPYLNRPLHLSFDIDSCDPSVVVATGSTFPTHNPVINLSVSGTKARGGLTFREARHICERLAETGTLVSMDVAELNPLIGKR